MDRNLEALDNAPAFSLRRALVTLALSALIVVGGALLVRTFPSAGFEAGYSAATSKGERWIGDHVNAAGGTPLSLCVQLHDQQVHHGTAAPDYEAFINGCRKAVDDLLGRSVPIVAPSASASG